MAHDPNRTAYNPDYKEKERYSITIHFFDDVLTCTPQVVDHFAKDGYLVIHYCDGARPYKLRDIWKWTVHYPQTE